MANRPHERVDRVAVSQLRAWEAHCAGRIASVAPIRSLPVAGGEAQRPCVSIVGALLSLSAPTSRIGGHTGALAVIG